MPTYNITTAVNMDSLVKLGSVASLAWSSVTTTVSITQANHGYVVGDPFYISQVTVSTGSAGPTVGAKTVLGVTSSSVFTVTGTSNTGTGTLTCAPTSQYNINGGYLTVDSHSRYGKNQNTSEGLGNITMSASLGGTIEFISTGIRTIAYGSGYDRCGGRI